MPIARTARWLAVALLILEGLPGITVGGSLAPTVSVGGLPIVLGLIGYGIASLTGALGLFLNRRWGWPVALVTVLVGLVVLIVVLGIAGGRDDVIQGGLVVWAVTLIALLVARPRPT